MKCLSRSIAPAPLTLAEDDTESSLSTCDGRGGACRPATHDDYVGIDWSEIHGPSLR
jgi:hypothetical protein